MRLKSLLLVMLNLYWYRPQTRTRPGRTRPARYVTAYTERHAVAATAGRTVGLSEEDWGRYQALMAGPRGIRRRVWTR